MSSSSYILVFSVIVGAIVALFFFAANAIKKARKNDEDGEKEKRPSEQQPQKAQQAKKKSAASTAAQNASSAKDTFKHSWLMTSLKGHSGRVVDIDLSDNCKYLATAAEDRSVLVWPTKAFKEKEHKSHRGNVQYDDATKVKWSPDSRAFIVNKANANCAEVYKIAKKEDGGGGLGGISAVVTFPAKHESDVIGLGFASTGKFVMTCSDKTDMIIWSIRGDVLAKIDTYTMKTNCAKVSSCGRFVAASGFTPDVKIWEVKFSKSGEFDKVQRAFELTGHTSGVFHFSFNADSSRVATVSKDGTWRVFDTAVDYTRGQDAACLQKGDFFEADEDTLIALSSDGAVVAISAPRASVVFFCAESGREIGRLEKVHTTATLTALLFDKEDRWLFTAGDKHVRVFHNAPGFKLKAKKLREKLKTASTAGMRENLETQIKELEEKLVKMEF